MAVNSALIKCQYCFHYILNCYSVYYDVILFIMHSYTQFSSSFSNKFIIIYFVQYNDVFFMILRNSSSDISPSPSLSASSGNK